MTKKKEKKVRSLAGEFFRYAENIPGDVCKKLNAEQIAIVCALIASQRHSAVESFRIEQAATKIARFRVDWSWLSSLKKKAQLLFERNGRVLELPNLSVGVSAIRMWFR